MNWYHYSAGIKVPELQTQKKNWKPQGLWFAKGTEWKDWCDSEGFAPNSYTHLYRVTELPNNILYLDTVEKVKKFCQEYVDSIPGYAKYSTSNLPNWTKVSEDYDGIMLKGIKNLDLLEDIPCGLLFAGLDVDSLIIWNPRHLKWNLVKNF